MLIGLSIENFAIVKHLELDFFSGMNVFTGETGAGKSIMIDALMLALGGRADASVVRIGESKCDISASFQIDPDSPPARWLAQHDVTIEDHVVILRRIISAEGRSKSTVNGQPFPIQKMKEISEMLVHIHGQHQQQTLMQHPNHRIQLDRYASHEAQLSMVKSLYKTCIEIQKEIDDLSLQHQQVDRLELLEFQIKELQALDLQAGELERLDSEHQLLHHARDYLDTAQQIMLILEGEDNFNVTHGLHQVLQLLQALPQELQEIKTLTELLNSALIQAEEASSEIQSFSDQVQLDPERLQEVEARMSAIHQVARKYKLEPSALIDHANHLEQELEFLKSRDIRLAELKKAYEKSLLAYEQAAMTLRESRKTAAAKLASDITAHIQQLGMPKGYVELAFSPLDKIQAHGMDKVEYKVCTNPGTTPDSLNKIASGGELSRISLAIELITAEKGATPTLMFDEVDVGIGGAVAALVGQLLRKLGQRLQVFCVTHQAQVASCANHHFLVSKESDKTQTFSKIDLLDKEEKVSEIARMLGGLTITAQTKTHARELIEQSA